MISTMNRHAATALMLAACSLSASADQPQKQTPDQRPNIVVIVTDDHSYQTLGTCEKDSPMPYPNFRKLADEGMVFDRSYCANSLCGPSRACIYTGRHSHMNGYLFNEHAAPFDGSQPTFPKCSKRPVTRRPLSASGTWKPFRRAPREIRPNMNPTPPDSITGKFSPAKATISIRISSLPARTANAW